MLRRIARARSMVVSIRPAVGAALRPFATATKLDDDSHEDFKPKMKAAPTDPEKLKLYVTELVSKHKVVLFMKGTPQEPMCGFSKRVAQLLQFHGVDIHGVDILSNPTMRTYMKEHSNWPTFPQLYVNGEFVGGCDIATQMHQSGELATLLNEQVKQAELK